MKTILFGLVCILFAKVSLGQQTSLPFDENHKYIYYQVVDLPGAKADSLQSKGLSFLKSAYPKAKLKTTTINEVSGTDKFLTYGGISVLKHEKGEINYHFTIEFKDQKYRYWITGFVFTPYERDRYGNFVPKQGIDIPLETLGEKVNKKDADGSLDETVAFCKKFGEGFKQYILNVKLSAPKKEVTTKKVVTDKW